MSVRQAPGAFLASGCARARAAVAVHRLTCVGGDAHSAMKCRPGLTLRLQDRVPQAVGTCSTSNGAWSTDAECTECIVPPATPHTRLVNCTDVPGGGRLCQWACYDDSFAVSDGDAWRQCLPQAGVWSGRQLVCASVAGRAVLLDASEATSSTRQVAEGDPPAYIVIEGATVRTR